MASRDYYDILGVGKRAGADDIKSAYRKLARQLHPDVNKAADAQRKFTEVQNAYDVLSDGKKRGVYDQFGPSAFESGASEQAASRAAGYRQGRGSQNNQGGVGGRANAGTYSWSNVGGGTSAGEQGPGFGDFDPEDLGSIFESMFGGGSQPGGAGAAPGEGKRKSTSGRRAGRTRNVSPSGHAAGSGEGGDQEAQPTAELSIDFLTAAKGGSQRVAARAGGGQRGAVDVTIPAAVEEGTLLRVPGGGEAGADLILKVRIAAHRYFRRGESVDQGVGLDLYVDVPLSIAEATLGGAVPVPTLGDNVELQLPPGSPSGRKMRLRGLGLVDPKGRKGDLYALLKIVPPPRATISDLEATLLKEIASRGGAYRAW